MDLRDQAGEMTTIDCRFVTERLPWFLRETLPEGERDAVRDHLESCSSCRAELEATRRMLAIAEAHAPAGLLADYAAGLPVDSELRRALEEHLASCPTCSEELAMALTEPEEGAPPRPAHRAARPREVARAWRPAAIAAGLIAFVATGLLLRDAAPGPSAFADVALVELLPTRDRVRAASPEPTASARDRATTLVLVSDRVPDEGSAFRLRVRDARGAVVATLRGLAPDDSGAFVVHVPAGAWPAGDLSLVLEPEGVDETEPFATWELRRTD